MAISAPTLRSDFSGFLPEEIAGPIFERAARMSVVQQLSPQIPLGSEGKKVPVVTGRPVANWTDEGGTKPATSGTMSLVTMTPEKLAAIVVVAEEVVRANPGGYVTSLRGQLAEAFAIAFDYAALYDLGGDGTGTGPFSDYVAETTKSVELGGNSQANGGIYKDLVDGMSEVISDSESSGRRFRFTGFALDALFEPRIRGAVDSTGRPLWVDLPENQESNALSTAGTLLGRRSFMGEGVANPDATVLGFGGDWSQTAWGVVGGINYSLSREAAVTINGSLVSLWEKNLVAIRAEAEYGFVIADTDGFVQYRNDSGS